MKLASHNSMTFLPVKQWWLKPFAWLAKCQNKDIANQLYSGCKFFDIRVTPRKLSIVCPSKDTIFDFGHGYIRYDCGDKYQTTIDWLEIIDFYAAKINEKIYVRILLETNKRDKDIEEAFKVYCEMLQYSLHYITFCGGHTKADWSQIYDFGNNLPANIVEEYSSMPSNPKIYGIFPWLYAKLNNKKSIKKHQLSNNYLMLDFI